ncbi:ankyrin repeat domain-containing protein [Bdellovibrio bacteriovorus]|uniref:ankyrin repeat domain-containing protein n=1 Tax=Bdellovibrio bacteriovorus TaxID=959 RepID=UPI0035A58024
MSLKNEPVVVFAYDFPHRKTYDFILDLMAVGLRNLVVLAAPHKELKNTDRRVYFPRSLIVPPPIGTPDLCESLGLKLYLVDHGDSEKIRKIVDHYDIKLGIVAGARIIPGSVIELFSEGIVNFHPGKIPETSGLDSLYYTIKNMAPPGVTVHYIDHKVDAGRYISFEETPISLHETLETLVENIYQTQRVALRRFVDSYFARAVKTEIIDRPKKNQPMTPDEKLVTLSGFENWRAEIHLRQQTEALLVACKDGNLKKVEQILSAHPALLGVAGKQGWTPLIVACFNQSREVVRYLLELGADPNQAGAKGTTPAMYAKTKLINQENADYSILDLLYDSGADFSRLDSYGKDILHYVELSGDRQLLEKVAKYVRG